MGYLELIQAIQEDSDDSDAGNREGACEFAKKREESPPWPPRPPEVATWPIPWRERWGRRSNELEDQGVKFPESERQAYHEVKAAMERGDPAITLPEPLPPVRSDPPAAAGLASRS